MEDPRDRASRVMETEVKVRRMTDRTVKAMLRDKAKLRDKAVDAKRDADKRQAGRRKKAKRKAYAPMHEALAPLHASLMSTTSEMAIDTAAPNYMPGTRA